MQCRSLRWSEWLKHAVDQGHGRFLVTDSAAAVLSEGARESGLGRWDEHRIEVLSFREFLRFQARDDEPPEAALPRLPNAYARYLSVGGRPEFVFEESLGRALRRIRVDTVDRSIVRDLLRRDVDVERVRELFVYLVEDSGAIFDAKARARLLQRPEAPAVDRRSLEKWTTLLLESLLLSRLDPYAPSATGRLAGRSHPKLYASDHGLVVAFSGVAEPFSDPSVTARALEAAVFLHLREVARSRGVSVSYLRERSGQEEIDFVIHEGAKPLAFIEVTTSKRGGGKQAPYALLDKGRRGYHKRAGSRTRFMTREELAASFSDAPVDKSKPAKAREQVEATMIDWIGGPAGLRVLVRPVEPIQVEIATLDLYSLLVDASKTGNREVGWTFVNSAGKLKPINPRGWRFGKRGDVQWLELFTETGQLEFWVSRERLHWRGNASELWPTCVLELPTSIMRLAKTLYTDHYNGRAHPDVVLGLGLYGIGDCTLRPHSPESIGYLVPRTAVEPLQQLVDRDYFASTPVTVSWDELAATPDRCAFHLVAQLYREFGYDEDQIPREFNRQTGQLVIPR